MLKSVRITCSNSLISHISQSIVYSKSSTKPASLASKVRESQRCTREEGKCTNSCYYSGLVEVSVQMLLNLYSRTSVTNRSVTPGQLIKSSHINTFMMSVHLTFIWLVWAGQTTAAVIYRAGTVWAVFVWASITVITSTELPMGQCFYLELTTRETGRYSTRRDICLHLKKHILTLMRSYLC